MGILSSLANIFTGGVAGGITGVIGAVSSAVANYKLKKLEYEHLEKMTQLQMDADRVRGDVALKIAEAKSKAAIDAGEMEAWKASYAGLSRKYFDKSYFQFLPDWSKPVVGALFAFLDFVRGIVRPLVTFYVLLIMSVLAYKVYQTSPTAFTTSADKIVDIILYIGTTVICWWFGSRELSRIFNKDKG